MIMNGKSWTIHQKKERERDEQNEWMNEWLYGWMEKNEIKNCQNFFFRKNKKQTFLFECEIKKKIYRFVLLLWQLKHSDIWKK